MAKKTLLNEATVRRFMGLANINSSLSSNFLKETYTNEAEEEGEEMKEGYMEAEEDPADAEMEMGAEEAPAELDAEPADDAAEPMEMDGDAEVDPDALKDLRDRFEAVMAPLEAAMGGEAGEEPADMDMAPDADLEGGDELDAEAPPEGEEEEEELAEVTLELSEEQIVQEVARRVASRIIKAKRAHNKMQEALGKK